MPKKIWDPKNCVNCPLFPGSCPYMGVQLRSFLCVAVEKISGDRGIQALEDQRRRSGCQGDCESCDLPAWMQNC